MKKYVVYSFFALLVISTAGCSGNLKDRLAHKWRVDQAAYFDEELSNSQDSIALNGYYAENEAMEKLYKGRIYDLRPDGTYTAEGGLEAKAEGTWEVDGDIVNLNVTNGEPQKWYFFDGGHKIAADSSMYVRLNSSETKYEAFVLKPVAGEKIITDFD